MKFQEICYGPFVLDIGMTITGCCYPDGENIAPQLVSSFLDGYQSARTLLDLEMQALAGKIS